MRQALTLNSCLIFPEVIADSTATESKDGVGGKSSAILLHASNLRAIFHSLYTFTIALNFLQLSLLPIWPTL